MRSETKVSTPETPAAEKRSRARHRVDRTADDAAQWKRMAEKTELQTAGARRMLGGGRARILDRGFIPCNERQARGRGKK